MVSGPATRIRTPEPRCFFFNSCPAKATANSATAACSSEGGGGQLYFGEVVTLWGRCSRLLWRPRGPAPGGWSRAPLPVPARPRAHVERRGAAGVDGRAGRPALRVAPISGSRRESVSRTGFPGWGRGGRLPKRLVNFRAPALGR